MHRKRIFKLPAPSVGAIEAIKAVCSMRWAAAKAGSPLPWWLAQERWLALDLATSSRQRPTGSESRPRG